MISSLDRTVQLSSRLCLIQRTCGVIFALLLAYNISKSCAIGNFIARYLKVHLVEHLCALAPMLIFCFCNEIGTASMDAKTLEDP